MRQLLLTHCYGAGDQKRALCPSIYRWSALMPQPNDFSRSLVCLDPNSTIIAVVELSRSNRLVRGVALVIELVPMRSLTPAAGTTSRQLPQGRAH